MQFAATWTKLEMIILSEVRQRKVPHAITYMWDLKNDRNELTKQKQAQGHRKQIYGY